MNWNELFRPASETLMATLPMVVLAVVVLLLGWLFALMASVAVRKALGIVIHNKKFRAFTDMELSKVDRIGARIVFWFVLLVAVVAVLDVLELNTASSSMQQLIDPVVAFIPKLLTAAIIALAAWLVAVLVRILVRRGLGATRLDKKLAKAADVQPFSTSIGNILYWVTLLLFLPAVLGALNLQNLLEPIQEMTDEILAMLPNILSAALIAIIGWFVAKVLRDLVYNLLVAFNFDRFGERAGLKGKVGPSRLVALLVFIFVFVPALIAGLDTLQIESISGPATDMLHTFMSAIPDIFAAAVILTVAYLLARFVASLVESLLDGFGFNQLPARMGMAHLGKSGIVISKVAGTLVSFFIMLFAVVEAANRLEFYEISNLVSMFIEFGGQVLLGTVILVVGFWLANIVHKAVGRVSGGDTPALAGLARIAILGLVIAMGLRAMGIADDIVNVAFALTLGAVAVAVALSFGLGGREAAGRQMEYWLSRLRK